MGAAAFGLLVAPTQAQQGGATSSAPAGAAVGQPDGSSGVPAYVFAITALSDGGIGDGNLPFLTKLPALLLDALKPLPPRYEDASYREEAARQKVLATRFDKGKALYAKLSDAAALSLDPGLDTAARDAKRNTASLGIDQARDDLLSLDKAESTEQPAPSGPRTVQAWDGKGKLFDLGGDTPLRAGRRQSVDLVVTGSAKFVGNYLDVSLEGYDVALGRRVFSWEDYAAPDDPTPVAVEFAGRLRQWLASSPVARFDLSVNPRSARLVIDGSPVDSSDTTLFSPDQRRLSVVAWAPGYGQEKREIELDPGSDGGLRLDLKPQAYGKAEISGSPPNATILAGGREVDSTQPLPLGGIRDIGIALAPDYETKMFVLPASGSVELSYSLHPSDKLGPGKRADRAKDEFYVGLGLVAIGIPAMRLAQGYQNMYLEANFRQGFGFVSEWNVANLSYWAAAAGTTAAAAFAVVKLITLLGSL